VLERRHPIEARVEVSAIAHNCMILREIVPSGCWLAAVVKCNAYGHGVEIVLPVLKQAKVEMLCVATIHEAEKLVSIGCDIPILMLLPELSIYRDDQKKELASWIVEKGIRTTVTNSIDLAALSDAAAEQGVQATVHFKLDTGMSRMGLNEESLSSLLAEAIGNSNIRTEGLYTHLATADEENKKVARAQLKRFEKFVSDAGAAGLEIPIAHAAGSGAIIDLPESHFNMVRPGISVYGCVPSHDLINHPGFRPAMKLVSYLVLVKSVPKGSHIGYGCTYKAKHDMTIGVVPVGYGDGYDRRLSNKGQMTIEGHLVPVVGRVSMDQTVVDLTALVKQGIGITVGQEIVVVTDVRGEPNTFEAIAQEIGAVPYELMTGLGNRVNRIAVQ
jgi:alanine racemase